MDFFGALLLVHRSQVDPALHGTGHDRVTEQQRALTYGERKRDKKASRRITIKPSRVSPGFGYHEVQGGPQTTGNPIGSDEVPAQDRGSLQSRGQGRSLQEAGPGCGVPNFV